MKIATSFLSFAIFFSLSFLPVLAGEIITHKAQVSGFPGTVILSAHIPVNEDNTDRYVSFEWGENINTPLQTGVKTISPYFPSTSNYYYKLSDLKPDGTYYYRLLVKEEDGHVWRGPVQSFVAIARPDYNSTFSSGDFEGKTFVTSKAKTFKQVASGGSLSVSSPGNTNPVVESAGSKNTSSGLWALLFGSANSSNVVTLGNLEEQSVFKEEPVSFYQDFLSFSKWLLLAMIIFLTTALFVYATSLYEQIKDAKKKNKKDKRLSTAPVNLPR